MVTLSIFLSIYLSLTYPFYLTFPLPQISFTSLSTPQCTTHSSTPPHIPTHILLKVPFKRAVFHEITKDAILKSFENPREIDMNIVQSQETRRLATLHALCCTIYC